MSRMFLCLMPLRVRRTSEMTLGLQKIKSSVKIAGVKPSFLCFPFKMEKKNSVQCFSAFNLLLYLRNKPQK